MSDSTVRIATRDIYNSDTGEFFAKNSVLPNDDTAIFEPKTRNGKIVIPGVEEDAAVLTTHIASEGRADAGAGQNGRKPAKTPAKKVAAVTDGELKGEVVEGGAARDTARDTAPASTGSAFE